MVEPGDRGPGGGPRPPDRSVQVGDGVPAGGQGHHRGEGDGAQGGQAGTFRLRLRRRRAVQRILDSSRDPGADGRLAEGFLINYVRFLTWPEEDNDLDTSGVRG